MRLRTPVLAALPAAILALAAAQARNAPSVDPSTPESAARPGSLAAAVRFVVSPTGNEARYRVREQLAGFDLPNDAVGTTHDVQGAIVVGSNGAPVPAESRIEVNLTGLKSDKDRRDGYVQRRLLETEQYPSVVLEPVQIRGLTGAVPAKGSRSFEVVGNLTVKGVTKPTVWKVDAAFDGARVTGTARTAFTFDDFQLTQPRVPVVLSVADTIHLEYDFDLVRAGS